MPRLRLVYRHFMHDPEVCKDLMAFKDRLIAQPDEPGPFTFGYGRR